MFKSLNLSLLEFFWDANATRPEFKSPIMKLLDELSIIISEWILASWKEICEINQHLYSFI